MTKEELIRNLKYTMEKHKNDKVDTFGTNISLMCKDILDYLEQPTTKDCLVVEDCVSRKAMLNAITEIDNNVNMDIYTNEVREIIKALPPVTPTRKVGKWGYKQLGFRKYGLVCTSCGYATHIGYDFNSMEEFKDMIETKLQNPHITKDKYCRKCGAEMRGNEND